MLCFVGCRAPTSELSTFSFLHRGPVVAFTGKAAPQPEKPTCPPNPITHRPGGKSLTCYRLVLLISGVRKQSLPFPVVVRDAESWDIGT